MSNDHDKQAEDEALFQEMMQDAEPLDQDKIKPWHKRLPPFPIRHPPVDDNENDLDPLSETEVSAGDELSFCRPGLQKRVFQDLRRGRLEVELELDLHGYTAQHAESIMELFLRDCHKRRIRCVRIIHGKGYGSEDRQPVLKRKVNHWLRQRRDVMAFCSATRRDGGTGATYVLLRSASKNRE